MSDERLRAAATKFCAAFDAYEKSREIAPAYEVIWLWGQLKKAADELDAILSSKV